MRNKRRCYNQCIPSPSEGQRSSSSGNSIVLPSIEQCEVKLPHTNVRKKAKITPEMAIKRLIRLSSGEHGYQNVILMVAVGSVEDIIRRILRFEHKRKKKEENMVANCMKVILNLVSAAPRARIILCDFQTRGRDEGEAVRLIARSLTWGIETIAVHSLGIIKVLLKAFMACGESKQKYFLANTIQFMIQTSNNVKYSESLRVFSLDIICKCVTSRDWLMSESPGALKISSIKILLEILQVNVRKAADKSQFISLSLKIIYIIASGEDISSQLVRKVLNKQGRMLLKFCSQDRMYEYLARKVHQLLEKHKWKELEKASTSTSVPGLFNTTPRFPFVTNAKCLNIVHTSNSAKCNGRKRTQAVPRRPLLDLPTQSESQVCSIPTKSI